MSEIENKEVLEEVETEEEFTPDENTDWKARAEELEQKRREDGIRHRERTKALKAQIKPQDKNEPSKKQEVKDSFDYAELAYLTAKGVPDEDQDFLLAEMKSTSKGLKDLLGFQYVKETLNTRKEQRIVKEALPTGGKRSPVSEKSSPEYWLAQIEAGKAKLADIPDTKLRRDVLDMRIKSEENTKRFSRNPVIRGG